MYISVVDNFIIDVYLLIWVHKFCTGNKNQQHCLIDKSVQGRRQEPVSLKPQALVNMTGLFKQLFFFRKYYGMAWMR